MKRFSIFLLIAVVVLCGTLFCGCWAYYTNAGFNSGSANAQLYSGSAHSASANFGNGSANAKFDGGVQTVATAQQEPTSDISDIIDDVAELFAGQTSEKIAE